MLARTAFYYCRLRMGMRFRTREQLLHHQQKQLAYLLRFVGRDSPFYAARTLRTLADAPIINKAVMMEHFDTINTAGIRKDEALALAMRAERTRDFAPSLRGLSVGMSSGTSGHRGLFVVSRNEMAMHVAAMIARALPGNPITAHRIALFLRSDNNLYQSSNVALTRLAYFDLQRPFSELATALQQFRPTVLVAPATVLRQLAHEAEREKLCIRPCRIIAVAEVLEPQDAAHIGRAFGQTVHQIYECTEGFLGTTCRHGVMHLNEDLVHFEREYLDADRTRFVPIVTDLYRTTQPHIRYRLDDVLVLRRDPCPCGSVLTALEAIEGRCDDVLYFRHRDRSEELVPVYADLIRRAVLLGCRKADDYQVVQRSIDEVEVSLKGVCTREDYAEVSREFLQLAQTMKVHPPCISYVDYCEMKPTSKRRRVQRRMQLDQA